MADVATTSQPHPEDGLTYADHLSHAQMHGEACWLCDASGVPLFPAGHVYTHTCAGSAPLGWAVVTCHTHTLKEAC
jgi:hypothetical protein